MLGNHVRSATITALLLLAALLGGCSTVSPQMAQGRTLYEQHCAGCHGVNGEGQANWQLPDASGNLPAPPHNDGGHTWHHSDAQLLTVIAEGRNAMPGYEDILTPAQQEAVLAYIKTFWSPEIRAAQEGIN
jgi:mono/diheme cytochrome c family protein